MVYEYTRYDFLRLYGLLWRSNQVVLISDRVWMPLHRSEWAVLISVQDGSGHNKTRLTTSRREFDIVAGL